MRDTAPRARSLGLTTPETLRRAGLQASAACACGAPAADQGHLLFDCPLPATVAARRRAIDGAGCSDPDAAQAAHLL
eukprot:10915953-Alexandrium_andersonii.AAC.1